MKDKGEATLRIFRELRPLEEGTWREAMRRRWRATRAVIEALLDERVVRPPKAEWPALIKRLLWADVGRAALLEVAGLAVADLEGAGLKGTGKCAASRICRLRGHVAAYNQGIVGSIAGKYAAAMPFDDALQDGNVGLIYAIDRFDPERGCRFSTYATWWIKHAITRALATTEATIRVPVYVHEAALATKRTSERLNMSLGRAPTSEELEASCPRIARLPSVHSLDHPIDGLGTGIAVYPLDILSADDPSPLEYVSDQQTTRAIRDAIASLPPKLQYIMEQRFLHGRTLYEIGVVLQLSRERVRQLESLALDELRKLLGTKGGSC